MGLEQKRFLNIKFLTKTSFDISFLLLMYLFATTLLTAVGMIFGISISRLHLPMSIGIVMLLYVIVSRKRKTSTKIILVSLGVSLGVMIISALVASFFFDTSYDGLNYHMHAMSALVDGWNPVQTALNTGYYADMNANFFAAKGVWYFGAAMASFTTILETTKAFMLVMAGSLFFFLSFMIFKGHKEKRTTISKFVVALFLACNPILILQLPTNYTDALMGNLLLLLLLILIMIDKKQLAVKAPAVFLSIVAIIAIVGNIKFTGLFFIALFCGLYGLKWLVQYVKAKEPKRIITYVVVVLVGCITVIIIGVNPYITNVQRGYNMFHPVFGDQKIDLVGGNVPKDLRGKSSPEKLFLSTASEVSSGFDFDYTPLKLPFELKVRELLQFTEDVRLGGFGPFFALSFLIALGLLAYMLLHRLRKKEFFAIFCIMLVALVFPESWWARYYPLLWAIPCLLLFLAFEMQRKVLLQVIRTALTVVLTVNLLLMAVFANFKYLSVNEMIQSSFTQMQQYPAGTTFEVRTTIGLFGYVLGRSFERRGIKYIFVEPKEGDGVWDINNSRFSARALSKKVVGK